jgi:predicted DNA-binding protein
MNEAIDSKNDELSGQTGNGRLQTPIRMPSELQEKLDAMAARKGVSRNPLILMALWAYVEAEESKTTTLAVAA